MKIAAVQMRSEVGNVDRNVARAIELIQQAADAGADVVVLPEFFNTEYFAQYRDNEHVSLAEPLDGFSISAIREIAAKLNVWVVATLYERHRAGIYYDTAAVIDRQGEINGVYRKTHPAGVFSVEKLFFRYGDSFGIHQIEGWPVGISICYDNLFPETNRVLAVKGAELIICPFASHPGNPVWLEMFPVRAFENGSYVVVANKVGLEGEWTFGGRSMIVHPSGERLAVGSDQDDDVLVQEVDRTDVEHWRRRFPMFRDRRPDLYGALVADQETL